MATSRRSTSSSIRFPPERQPEDDIAAFGQSSGSVSVAYGYPDPAGAMHRATIAVGQTIRAQATIMGYVDSFALIGVVLLVAVLAVAMLREGAAAGGAAH